MSKMGSATLKHVPQHLAWSNLVKHKECAIFVMISYIWTTVRDAVRSLLSRSRPSTKDSRIGCYLAQTGTEQDGPTLTKHLSVVSSSSGRA